MTDDGKMIKVLNNGPYLVLGGIPLKEELLVKDAMGKAEKWKEERRYYPDGPYTLCRCGKSRDKPFCTCDHIGFNGFETADRSTYESRAMVALETEHAKLLQDFKFCIGAGFCHGKSYVDKNIRKKETVDTALQQTYDCQGGSLLIMINGERKEPKLEKCISAATIDSKRGPLLIKGGIPVQSADGYVYEIRNRTALCTCGKSKNMPFCDSSHMR
jgi:CDGSH-type Zn-finger protein